MDSKELRGLVEAYSEVYSPIDEGKSSRPRYSGPERVGLGPAGSERRTEKREAHAENRKGHTEGPGTVTKNPKKLRKQKAMGELGGSGKAEVEEGYIDVFDVVLEFLQAEGYAETLEEAEWMMANQLNKEDIANILEVLDTPEKAQEYAKKNVKSMLGAFAKGVLNKDISQLKTIEKRKRGAELGKRKAERKAAEEN